MKKGDLDGALSMLQKCLTVQKKLYGEEHIRTATSYYNIGVAMATKGYVDGALLMFQKCLTIREKVCGEEHVNTLATKKRIADLTK